MVNLNFAIDDPDDWSIFPRLVLSSAPILPATYTITITDGSGVHVVNAVLSAIISTAQLPGCVAPADGTNQSSPVTFSWTASSASNIDHYELDVQGAVVGDVDLPEITGLSYTTALANDTYSWGVEVRDQDGNVGWRFCDATFTVP